MFKGDSADMCAGKFPLVSIGGRTDTSSVRRRGARNPIGASGNSLKVFGGWVVVVLKITLVFCFGPRRRFCSLIWTWTKLTNIKYKIHKTFTGSSLWLVQFYFHAWTYIACKSWKNCITCIYCITCITSINTMPFMI